MHFNNNNKCTKKSIDKLTIFDGPIEEAEQIGEFCGYRLPDVIESTSNSLYIRLVTDTSGQRRGFAMSFFYGQWDGGKKI